MPPLPSLAVVSPRLHEPGTVGGAETLLYTLARDAAAAGCRVELLATCARSHVTWANEAPEGAFERDGMSIRRFPVDSDRDAGAFQRYNEAICRGETLTDDEEADWLRQSVNSAALVGHLREHLGRYDFVLAGPYLFGLVEAAMRAAGDKALLVPCLHDEAFARVRRIARMFGTVRGCLFNTEPERALAHRLYPPSRPTSGPSRRATRRNSAAPPTSSTADAASPSRARPCSSTTSTCSGAAPDAT